MTALRTAISWTDSTWNFAVGCTKVSAGCDNCYAERLVNRLPGFGHTFGDVHLHLERLGHVRKFRPIRGADGTLSPHLVFINSISDWMHDAIPDAVIHQVLDTMEDNPAVIFQALTKRPIRARRLLLARYGNRGIPPHIWIGTSVESNQVAGRIGILRSLKDRAGGAAIFLSIEPLVGAIDELDFTGVDWAIFGGESGPHARIMQSEWLVAGIERAKQAGAAVWLKQHGQIRSNPLLHHAPTHLGITARFAWLVEHGLELLPGEKGGATLERRVTYREMPTQFHTLKSVLNTNAGVV